jgi:hypothetical protein
MHKCIFYWFFLILFIHPSWSKVTPPNYDFSLEAMKVFYPQQDFKAIEGKYGKSELYEDRGTSKVYRFNVAQIRYKFPVFVQVGQDGKVTDFFARLPSYFSHDIFHQTLIDSFGKQDEYSRKNKTALYIWNNKNNFKIYYAGACTITCFPIYLAIGMAQLNDGTKTPSLLESMAKLK